MNHAALAQIRPTEAGEQTGGGPETLPAVRTTAVIAPRAGNSERRTAKAAAAAAAVGGVEVVGLVAVR